MQTSCVQCCCFIFKIIKVLVVCLQFGENRRVLQALRSLLEEFRDELREEQMRRCQLQQAYANDKAAWEVKWTEMKCQAAQVQMASHRPPLKEHSNLVEKSCSFSKQLEDRKHVASSRRDGQI